MKFEYTTESLYVRNHFEGIFKYHWHDHSKQFVTLKQFTDFEWGNTGCIADLPYKKYSEYDAFIFIGTSTKLQFYRGNWNEYRIIPDSSTAKFLMTMFNMLDKPSLSIVLSAEQYDYSTKNKYRPNFNIVPYYDIALLKLLLEEFKLKGYKNILVHSNIQSDGTLDYTSNINFLLSIFENYKE